MSFYSVNLLQEYHENWNKFQTGSKYINLLFK